MPMNVGTECNADSFWGFLAVFVSCGTSESRART
uniref:Uncharacterized protein n=1 Tax=Rhizophora mucronata TaxID=61149 RepID=A0A2P2PXY4_RHIMU